MVAAAQSAAPQVLDINVIESVPATIGVSPDYPTVIEFGGMDIESVEASEGGQILAEVGGSTLSILANREDVNTEFAVSLIGGPTVRFTFVSDPAVASSERYVVSSEQPVGAAEESAGTETEEAEVQAEAGAEADVTEAEAAAAEAQVAAEAAAAEAEAATEAETQAEATEAAAAAVAAAAEAQAAAAAAAEAQAAAAEAQAAAAEMSQANSSGDLLSPPEVEALPPELEFRTSAYQPGPESMVIQYILTNSTENFLANDPQRLRIYVDGEPVPFEQVLPEAGQSRRLTAGEVEYGELFVPDISADAGDLTLEWELVEIGPGVTYRANSDLITALGEAPLFTPETVTTEADVTSGTATAEADAATSQTAESTQAAELTAEPEAPAAAQPADTQPTPQAAAPSATNEAEQALPPEILAEIRRRGSDITVIGDSFDAPEMVIAKEGDEVTGVSALDTWSLYTRESAEADVTLEGGEVCIDVSGESTLFQVQDVGFGYAGFPLTQGRTYRFTFEAYADKPIFFRSLVGLAMSPYSESFARVEALGTQPQTFFYTFEARRDSDLSRVAFLLGGNTSSFRICFDNIVLSEVGEVAEGAVSSDE